MKKEFLETGKIVGTHGVKGMVRVQPWSDSSDFLRQFSHFFIDADGKTVLKADTVQPHGNVVIIKFKGVDSIEEAERLRGKIIYISRTDISLPKGRYFVSDLLGCSVYHAADGTLLGTLSEVSETGANDVWHIKKEEKEYLVPAIDEVIVSVDVDNEKIVLNPMKGIFDDAD